MVSPPPGAPPPPPFAVAAAPVGPQSAAQALMPAWEHTKRVLFQPFQLRKWFRLGLIAMLAGVMGGGGGGGGTGYSGPSGSGGPGGGGAGPGAPDFEQFGQQLVAWYHAHAAAVLAGAVAVGLFLVVLSIVMLYVSSVFRFIFLESVITNETRIRDSWRRNKAEGFSYFLWQVGFGLLSLLVVGIVVGIPVGLMVMSLAGQTGGQPSMQLIMGSVGLILLAVFLLVIVALFLGVISAITRDFVLPLMYLRRIGVLEAWRQCWAVVTANKMGFFVYFLLKIVAAMAAGIAGALLGCLGILVAGIPLALLGALGYVLVQALGIHTWDWAYLWGLIPLGVVVLLALSYWITCVLLPIPVYFQSYALRYLGQVEPSAVTV